jgi:hypothetical protein
MNIESEESRKEEFISDMLEKFFPRFSLISF